MPRLFRKAGLVIIICSSTYTGGVALLVTKRRSAIFEKCVSEPIMRKNIFIFGIFVIFRAARLVAQGRSAGGEDEKTQIFVPFRVQRQLNGW
jgi:hypothetical protein